MIAISVIGGTMEQELLRADNLQLNMVEKYSQMVYRLAFSMMKNKYDADDIHQEVFVKFLKKTPRFDNEEHEKAWFIRVTVNCCTNYHKTAWKRKTVSLSEYERQEEAEIPIEQPDPDDLIETVKRLPEKYRAVIHLFYYEEMSVEEVAKALHRRTSTVRTQLVRARRMLGEWLAEEKG